MTTIVAATQQEPIVPGQLYSFENVLTRDGGAVYDLTGKTVRATIRCSVNPNRVIDPQLEGMTVQLGNPETPASAGGVTLAVSPALSALWTEAPPNPTNAVAYTIQYWVVEDYWAAGQLLSFMVRRFAA